MMFLSSPVKTLFMVGPTYAKRLEKLGIKTAEDLLYHFPFRWEDYSLISRIGLIQPGEIVTIRGTIIDSQNSYTKSGKKIQKAIIADESGTTEAIWFNQPYLVKTLKQGANVSLAGRVDFFGSKISFISPEYEIVKNNNSTVHTGRLVPVYPETYGVSSKWLRSRIVYLLREFLPQLSDWLPENLKEKYNLVDLEAAITQIHFPKSRKEIEQAKERLAFEELFLIQLAALVRKKAWKTQQLVHEFKIDLVKNQEFQNRLPFRLTNAQLKATEEILTDLRGRRPMNRLLEGDVGSGKTVVAAQAIYNTCLNGFESALMAPTEILANQHYKTLKAMLNPFGLKVTLLTGSTKKTKQDKEKKKADVYVGTHALIYDYLKPENLGLVIVDEQHRFGVEQRSKLIAKGKSPHFLTMTATPIPRTVALTFFGDLDLSVLDEMPPGRKLTKTWIVPLEKREAAYEWIKNQIIQDGSQAFIVCPLVEDSEAESLKNIRAATTEFERLKHVFPKLNLGLLHGRMKSLEKDNILKKFKDGKCHILVATPVVEVGIDIPKATIIIIEGADHFGLAQLHQLRGRVGRSERQSYCLLFASEKSREATRKLSAMKKHHSGFALAEIDLQMRGPGEIYGTQQHGYLELKIASLSDLELVQKTKAAAQDFVGIISQFDLLKTKLKNYTMKLVEPN